MFCQICLCGTLERAKTALTDFVPCYMHLQLNRVNKFSDTQGTIVIFLLMAGLMTLQNSFLCETFCAFITLVWLYTVVIVHVNFQLVWLVKTNSTKKTFVEFEFIFICFIMGLQMSLQFRKIWISVVTIGTNVGSLSSVTSFVNFKMPWIWKSLLTQATLRPAFFCVCFNVFPHLPLGFVQVIFAFWTRQWPLQS